ncbi:MAG: asparagine synthase (glutamine-hydrolyzing) [Chloroherpetonaceae bacterium]|nr:asparagine synthase (glutamine-hydrolyzing) [Chloroherpetonaceae bacterium]MDW8019860.1 asparagine synthase (glutamine-hydrolyzing) [Chloroherpetonaceae bacterium]
MCGIAGTVGFYDQELLEQMSGVMVHRGPDDSGIKMLSTDSLKVGLAFRRLAIIDLSPLGHQPMSTPDERVWIIFNGEIYNYLELRQVLQAKGYIFRSRTDTEVILNAYLEWGTACVERLNGMWAFALVDTQRNLVMLSRDRVGEKPLYYAQLSPERLIFASEIKSLLQCEELPSEANPEGVLSTLFFLWTPEPRTAFKGIEKLPAGCNLLIQNGRATLQPYWDIDFKGYGDDRGEQHYLDELDALLQDTVRRQMIADVKVSAFLSGGLDSSLIAALMTQQKGEPITTYTIAFTEADKKFEAMPDDQKYAKIVAKHIGADYREIVIKPNVVELLPKLVYHLDEPIADPASINTYLICKAAKESGTTVLLSGMGADELFSGYRKHLAVKMASLYKRLPQALRRYAIEPLINALPVASKKGGLRLFRWAKRFVRSASLPDFDAFIGSYAYYNETELRNLLTPEFQEVAMPDYRASYPIRRHLEIREALLSRQPQLDLVTMMCALDTKMFLASLNLTYSDKSSMAASVEERVPFVDYRIVEFAHRLPAKYKMGGNLLTGYKQKALLKKVAERYLPKEIVYRPKAPFGAPLRAWVRNDLDEMIDDLLSPERLRRRGIFRPAAITEMLRRHKSGEEDSAHRIWALLTLELWFSEFIDKRVKVGSPFP